MTHLLSLLLILVVFLSLTQISQSLKKSISSTIPITPRNAEDIVLERMGIQTIKDIPKVKNTSEQIALPQETIYEFTRKNAITNNTGFIPEDVNYTIIGLYYPIEYNRFTRELDTINFDDIGEFSTMKYDHIHNTLNITNTTENHDYFSKSTGINHDLGERLSNIHLCNITNVKYFWGYKERADFAWLNKRCYVIFGFEIKGGLVLCAAKRSAKIISLQLIFENHLRKCNLRLDLITLDNTNAYSDLTISSPTPNTSRNQPKPVYPNFSYKHLLHDRQWLFNNKCYFAKRKIEINNSTTQKIMIDDDIKLKEFNLKFSNFEMVLSMPSDNLQGELLLSEPERIITEDKVKPLIIKLENLIPLDLRKKTYISQYDMEPNLFKYEYKCLEHERCFSILDYTKQEQYIMCFHRFTAKRMLFEEIFNTSIALYRLMMIWARLVEIYNFKNLNRDINRFIIENLKPRVNVTKKFPPGQCAKRHHHHNFIELKNRKMDQHLEKDDDDNNKPRKIPSNSVPNRNIKKSSDKSKDKDLYERKFHPFDYRYKFERRLFNGTMFANLTKTIYKPLPKQNECDRNSKIRKMIIKYKRDLRIEKGRPLTRREVRSIPYKDIERLVDYDYQKRMNKTNKSIRIKQTNLEVIKAAGLLLN